MPRLSPTAIALLVGLLVLLLVGLVFMTGRDRTDQDRLGDNASSSTASADPEKRCGSQATYDLIKRELFRRAAQVRGSDQAAFDRLSAYSSIRMDAPMLRSEDEDLGAVSCSGTLSLDLPPGVAVVGGRRTLTADIGYSLQPAADRSGNVLTLSNAEAIITPLATLARTGSEPGLPQQPAPGDQPDPLDPTYDGPGDIAPPPGAPPRVNPAPPGAEPPPPVSRPQPEPQRQTSSANPSFNCRNARTRGEIAVCRDAGLASLDRQMSSQFFGALRSADSGQREQLQRTRSRFLRYRDGCRSDDCIADAYRGRMREISDIMDR